MLSHVKFADCIIDVAAFPTNIWLLFNEVVPIPPREIDNVPAVALLTFKLIIAVPEPDKLEAINVLVALFHIKFADCKTEDPFPINFD